MAAPQYPPESGEAQGAASQASPGSVVWVTGLSGSGKSTVTVCLLQLLRQSGYLPVLIDGDDIRGILGNAHALGQQARATMARTYSRLCELLARQGHIVLCATISLRHEVHAWNRSNIANYVEVLLDVPLPELRARDPKGIYRSAGRHGSVVGIDLAAQFPLDPDLRIPNYEPTEAQMAAKQIFEYGARRNLW